MRPSRNCPWAAHPSKAIAKLQSANSKPNAKPDWLNANHWIDRGNAIVVATPFTAPEIAAKISGTKS
jgi:hypothetical protein